MKTYSGLRDMKAYEFKMEDGEAYTFLGSSFDDAYEWFKTVDLSPLDILSVREYTPTVREH